jgi:hypothetical protein
MIDTLLSAVGTRDVPATIVALDARFDIQLIRAAHRSIPCGSSHCCHDDLRADRTGDR